MPSTTGDAAGNSPAARGRRANSQSPDKKTRSETFSQNDGASGKGHSPTRARSHLKSEPSSPSRSHRKQHFKKQHSVDENRKSQTKSNTLICFPRNLFAEMKINVRIPFIKRFSDRTSI